MGATCRMVRHFQREAYLPLFPYLEADLCTFRSPEGSPLFREIVPPPLLIAVNEIVVDGDLKDATMSLFQGRDYAEIVFDCGRQTRCRGKETSFYTVGDFNSKGLLSFVIHDGML